MITTNKDVQMTAREIVRKFKQRGDIKKLLKLTGYARSSFNNWFYRNARYSEQFEQKMAAAMIQIETNRGTEVEDKPERTFSVPAELIS